MIVTLAYLLAKRGPLPLSTAVDIIDRLASATESAALDIADLLAICPDTVEVEVGTDGLDIRSVAFKPSLRRASAQPYMAWPEYGAWLNGSLHEADDGPGGERSLVYCLGVLLYHLLADRPPFVAGGLLSLAMRHLSEEPLQLDHSRVSPAVVQIVGGCLNKDRGVRFESVATLRDALRFVHQKPSPGPQQMALINRRTGRRVMLDAAGIVYKDGTREIRIGRNDPHIGHWVDIDVADERHGSGTHRRQAIIRCSPSSGWTLEDWFDSSHPRGTEGLPTSVNGTALNGGECHLLAPGDVVGLGPVRMEFASVEAFREDLPDAEPLTLRIDLPIGWQIRDFRSQRRTTPDVLAAAT